MIEPLVRLTKVCKKFGEVVALDRATLDILAGEIHIILGENGAGKTSLMNVLSGLYHMDSGELRVDGAPVRIASPRDAIRLGVTMVHQHFELIANLTVRENIMLGGEESGWWSFRKGEDKVLEALMERFALKVPLNSPVRSLAIGLQQKVEILKTLYRQARLLILDEPTTFLTPQEVRALFATLQELVSGGLTIALITHKIQEAIAVGHRLTVMRQGRVVGTLNKEKADQATLISWLMGEKKDQAALPKVEPPPYPAKRVNILELKDVHVQGEGGPILGDVSFQVQGGEILGVAGVSGNGQRELVEAIMGILPVTQGEICLHNMTILNWSVARRLRAHISLVPEDRLEDGILPSLSIAESYVLGLHKLIFPKQVYRPQQVEAMADEAITAFSIRTPSPRLATAHLSGGNVQKIILARAMRVCALDKYPLLLAASPTRGLDLQTTYLVHQKFCEIAARGGAVLVISEDLDELMELAHRIVVLYQGKVVAKFARAEFDRFAIGEAMVGLHQKEEKS